MMKLKISALDKAQEESFSFTFRAGELDDIEEAALTGDVTVTGTVTFTGRVYRVAGDVRSSRSFLCDRCLKETTEEVVYTFEEEFKRSDEEAKDGEETLFAGDFIELGSLVRDTILAAQPIRNLCRPDCQGLCLKCGADLNEGECGCDRRSVNPKLAALQDLIKD